MTGPEITGPNYNGGDDGPNVVIAQPVPSSTGISDVLDDKGASGISDDDEGKIEKDNGGETKARHGSGNVAADIAEVLLEDEECEEDEEILCTACSKVFTGGDIYWKCNILSCTDRITLCQQCYSNTAQFAEHRNHMGRRSVGNGTEIGNTVIPIIGLAAST